MKYEEHISQFLLKLWPSVVWRDPPHPARSRPSPPGPSCVYRHPQRTGCSLCQLLLWILSLIQTTTSPRHSRCLGLCWGSETGNRRLSFITYLVFWDHEISETLNQQKLHKVISPWNLKWYRFGIMWYRLGIKWCHFGIKWHHLETWGDTTLELSDISDITLELNNITLKLEVTSP